MFVSCGSVCACVVVCIAALSLKIACLRRMKAIEKMKRVDREHKGTTTPRKQMRRRSGWESASPKPRSKKNKEKERKLASFVYPNYTSQLAHIRPNSACSQSELTDINTNLVHSI